MVELATNRIVETPRLRSADRVAGISAIIVGMVVAVGDGVALLLVGAGRNEMAWAVIPMLLAMLIVGAGFRTLDSYSNTPQRTTILVRAAAILLAIPAAIYSWAGLTDWLAFWLFAGLALGLLSVGLWRRASLGWQT